MLSKQQRLTKNRIDYLFKKGKKVANNHFVVKYLRTSYPSSRFCVVASVTLFPKAVARNRFRRQIYEILRLHPKLPLQSLDVMLITKNKAEQYKNHEDLEKAVLITLKSLI